MFYTFIVSNYHKHLPLNYTKNYKCCIVVINMKINKKLQTLCLILALGIILIIPSVTASAANPYKDCEDIKNNSKRQECEDKVRSTLLDKCIDGSKNKAKIEQCERTVPEQPYITAQKDKDAKDAKAKDGQLPNEAAAESYSCKGLTKQECLEKNPIVTWLNWGVNILAGIIGVGAILMVIWGGIQYITARDNPQAVAAAKQKIINVVIGIAAFIFMWAFLNWLVPGGVFK